MVMTYPRKYGDDKLHDTVNLIEFLELEDERPNGLADRCRKVAEGYRARKDYTSVLYYAKKGLEAQRLFDTHDLSSIESAERYIRDLGEA